MSEFSMLSSSAIERSIKWFAHLIESNPESEDVKRWAERRSELQRELDERKRFDAELSQHNREVLLGLD